MDRGTLRWLAAIAGLVLAGLWLILVLTGSPVLGWVPPSAAVALGVALCL
jgi:uncharacterized membrane protein YesL